MNFANIIRGIGGEPEINRTVGAVGAGAYIIGAHAFIAWNMAEGRAFDVTAYCLAFPAGLGVAVGSIAAAVTIKDRGVATARATDAATAQQVQDTAASATPGSHAAKAADQVVEAASAERDEIKGAAQP